MSSHRSGSYTYGAAQTDCGAFPIQRPWPLTRVTVTSFLLFFLLVCPVYGGRKGEKPRIVRAPNTVSTVVGQSALFVCLVEGNPAPTVQWKVSGVAVSETHFGKTVRAPRGSVLRVTNVLPGYNGALITCTATNALGRAEASANLIVYSDEAAAPQGYPQFLNSFSVIVAKKNAAVELECRATGEPQPEISWYKNSVPVDMTNPRFTQMDNGNLHISSLVEDDEGKFECSASNSQGTRLSSGDDLLVRENVETSLQLIALTTKRFRPHFTNVPAARQIVPPGGKLSLTCTAVGAPVPTVDWYRGSHRLHHEQLDKQPPGAARIMLLDLWESINVTCVAESSMGRIYHYVQVVVKALPQPPGLPQLIETGSTHAHVAFKPSPSASNSVVKHYLLFWLPLKQFHNQSLHILPTQLATLLQPTPLGFESSPRADLTQPSFSLLPIDTKNVSQTADGRLKVLDDKDKVVTLSSAGVPYHAIVASLSQLKPYTEYKLWARAVGLDNDASHPGPLGTFITQEIAPSSPPRNVHADAFSNAAVTVYWDPPSEANGRIRAYRVYYTDRPNLELAFWDTNIVDMESSSMLYTATGQTTVASASSTSPTSGLLSILSHLTTNATYFVRVSAVNGKGEGPASDIVVVIVRPGLLPRPRNLTAIIKSSHEIQLSWAPPEGMDQSSKPLKHYKLQYAPIQSLAKSPDQLQWITHLESATTDPVQTHLLEDTLESRLISNLKPDTQYLFSLASVSASGAGVSALVYARTKKYVPAEPTNLTVEAVSATDLKVRWQPPPPLHADPYTEVKSARIAYYDLSWRPSTITGGWLQTEHNSDPWASTSAVASSLLPDRHGFNRHLVPAYADSSQTSWYTTTISGLLPATYYVVQVHAVCPSGSGDRATANPVRTWDPPSAAPLNLRLFSQIVPPSGPQMPPQVLIKVSWEHPATREIEPNGTTVTPMTTYRVRWRLLLSGLTDSSSLRTDTLTTRLKRSVDRSGSNPDRWLFWSLDGERPDQPALAQLLPTKLRAGEMNTTELTWTPMTGLFLLGMTYEFRVAVITPTQAGHEAMQLIALEGSVPTGAPTELTTTEQPDSVYLSWAPPNWTHRHGPFIAYEVKCEAIDSVGIRVRRLNVTTENSSVNWPDGNRLSPQSLIAWPHGRVNLLTPELGAELFGRDFECRIRGHTKYGPGPWSPKIDVYAKQHAAVPPSPKHIQAVQLPGGDVRVSWAMPEEHLIQTLVSHEAWETGVTAATTTQLVYRRFAVYVSPQTQKNWTRYLTNGPVTELVVPKHNLPGHDAFHIVRVSSVGSGGHEGTWSDVVPTHRVADGGAVRVSNLSCTPMYDNTPQRWTLRLTWHTPSWLLVPSNAHRLLHYRVNYTALSSTARIDSRESSARISNPPLPTTMNHQLDGLQPNTVYAVSVRPVIRSEKAHIHGAVIDHFGMVADVTCATPNKVDLHVEPPWIIRPNGVRTDAKHVTVGCAAVSHTTSETPIPTQFQLLGRQLEPPSRAQVLAQWTHSRWSSSKSKPLFQVYLSLDDHVEATRSQRQGDKMLGLKLSPKVPYALALFACTNAALSNSHSSQPFNTQSLCYQSLWTQPVATNLAPPPVPQPRASADPDPDRVLWFTEPRADSASTLNKAPSDDATAHEPGPTSNLHGKRQSDASSTSAKSTRFSSSEEAVDVIHAINVRPSEKRSVKPASVSVLSVVICVTVALFAVGVFCLLVMIYKRRRMGITTSSGLKHWAGEHRRGRWSDSPAYALLNWVTLNKRKPQRPLSNSLNLSNIQGPPSGITVSLPPTLTPYSTGLVNNYCDDLVTSPRLQSTGTLCNGSMDPFRNSSQFGSLCVDAVHHDLLTGASTDTPNGTLMMSGLGSGVHRVDSISMGHRYMTSPSPSVTYNNPGQLMCAVQPESVPIFNAGSLKSVSTVGSKGVIQTALSVLSANPIVSTMGPRVLQTVPVSRPIGVNQLIDHVQTLKSDNGRLMAAEFESIDPGGQFTWEHSNRAVNRPKNRYANVIAYDHSRVILQPTSAANPDSDYINANYLDGFRKQNAYIATQGPLLNTIADFWRMVWEQRSVIIVSMTRLEERARIKCEKYWPGSGSCAASSTAPSTSSPNPIHFTHRTHSPDLKALIRDVHNNPVTSSIAPFCVNRFVDVLEDGAAEETSTVFANSSTSHHSLPEDNGWSANETELLSEATYGDVTVGLLDVIELAYYTIRTFVMHKAGSVERREVRQLQFTAWPDHGVPNHPAPLLMFLRRVRAECPPDAGPMIVHCSAGVGRTGAFILLDILLEQMRHEKVVDVFGTVSRLRAQRNFMVQTEDQYAFVYEALVEAAASGNTELTVRQLAAHWSRLTKPDVLGFDGTKDGSLKGTLSTGLELEFSQLVSQTRLTEIVTSVPSCVGLLSSLDPLSGHDDERLNGYSKVPCLPQTGSSSANKTNAATLRVNVLKNRSMDVVPHDANRVALKAVRGVEGSDYINASYIDGYRTRAAYIATQAPLSSTVDDFWRMIWETGSCLIVRLESKTQYGDPLSADKPVYWPINQSARHGFFAVDPIATYAMTSYVMREIRLTDTRDGTTRIVRQFDATPTTDRMAELEVYRSSGSQEADRCTDLLNHVDSVLETSITNTAHGQCTTPRRPLSWNFKHRYQSLCESMLDIVIQVHKTKEHFGMEGPITVHCDLGAGRTGVFLAITLVLERMRYEGVVDMFQTVKLLRWQRPGLVRTPVEYAFCYATALEYLESFERYVS